MATFSLKEVVVSTIVLGILLATLEPVMKARRLEADAELDRGHLRQVSAATLLYCNDNEGMMPLAFGIDSVGMNKWNSIHLTPADWPATEPLSQRTAYSGVHAVNSIYPYIMPAQTASESFEIPGAEVIDYMSASPVAAGKTKLGVSYAYNGLLHSYSTSAIARPDKLPLWTEIFGKIVQKGGIAASPVLKCLIPNEPCIYKPGGLGASGVRNGELSVIMTIGNGNQYVFGNGQNWAFSDGHVEFRPIGAMIGDADKTDYTKEVFAEVDPSGHGISFWSDGNHPYLFRPDFTFGN